MIADFSSLVRYLLNRRRQLQDWEAHPPILSGLMIFTMAVVSFGLSLKWMGHPQASLLLVGVPLYELLLAGVSFLAAKILKMRGRVLAAVVFLNMGTWPLVLSAPLTWLMMGWPKAALLWQFLGMLLALKIFGNWRESLEVAFEFTRFQAVVVLALSGLLLILAGLPLYR